MSVIDKIKKISDKISQAEERVEDSIASAYKKGGLSGVKDVVGAGAKQVLTSTGNYVSEVTEHSKGAIKEVDKMKAGEVTKTVLKGVASVTGALEKIGDDIKSGYKEITEEAPKEKAKPKKKKM